MIAKRVFLVKLPVKSAHTGKMYKLFGIPAQLYFGSIHIGKMNAELVFLVLSPP